jgi:hypothetical protein
LFLINIIIEAIKTKWQSQHNCEHVNQEKRNAEEQKKTVFFINGNGKHREE